MQTVAIRRESVDFNRSQLQVHANCRKFRFRCAACGALKRTRLWLRSTLERCNTDNRCTSVQMMHNFAIKGHGRNRGKIFQALQRLANYNFQVKGEIRDRNKSSKIQIISILLPLGFHIQFLSFQYKYYSEIKYKI